MPRIESSFQRSLFEKCRFMWKVLFLGQIFKMEILMDLHVTRSAESENQIFSVWSECMCVCVSATSITPKQIIVQQKHQIGYSAFVSHTGAI